MGRAEPWGSLSVSLRAELCLLVAQPGLSPGQPEAGSETPGMGRPQAEGGAGRDGGARRGTAWEQACTWLWWHAWHLLLASLGDT